VCACVCMCELRTAALRPGSGPWQERATHLPLRASSSILGKRRLQLASSSRPVVSVVLALEPHLSRIAPSCASSAAMHADVRTGTVLCGLLALTQAFYIPGP
jgi:hypothetical protein